MGEVHALDELGAGRTRLILHEPPHTPDVVVSGEGPRRRHHTGGREEVVVVVEPGRDTPGPGSAARIPDDRILQREVEQVRDRAVAGVGRELDRVGDEHLAEDLEVGDPGVARELADLRDPRAEECAVDVLRGVDPEPVDLVAADPVAVHLGQPLTTTGCSVKRSSRPKKSPCSKQVSLQPPKSMSPRLWYRRTSLSQAGRFALRSASSSHRRPRHRGNVETRKRSRPGEIGRVERLAVTVAVGNLVRADVPTTRGRDHVGGVIDDDVEVDLEPEVVGAVDEGGEVGVGPEVRVDRGEVEAPVAVVGGAVGLHGLLHDGWRHPQRREPERLDAREPLRGIVTGPGQPLVVPAVEVAGVGRVVAGVRARAALAAPIVRGISVRITVGHHEVDALTRERRRPWWRSDHLTAPGPGGGGAENRGRARRRL